MSSASLSLLLSAELNDLIMRHRVQNGITKHVIQNAIPGHGVQNAGAHTAKNQLHIDLSSFSSSVDGQNSRPRRVPGASGDGATTAWIYDACPREMVPAARSCWIVVPK
jgi:hypothetical protein